MTREESMLRQEFYAADLKSEYHREQKAKYDRIKMEIWRRIEAKEFAPKIEEIVNCDN
jgi:ribosomal protein L32E